MPKLFYLFLCICFCYANLAKAQTKFYTEAGASYIEHLSTGFGIDINSNHKIGIIYGSNFFVNTKEFYTAFLKYENSLYKIKFANLIPKVGCKGGYSVYTNKYYTWDLVAIVPYAGIQYKVNKNIALFTDVGVTISRELAMKRITLGEIGWYKRVLPEFKVGVVYKIGNND